MKFAKYPPIGARSQGGGQYGALWGPDYREAANDNIMIVAMIENPKGVAIADQIAAVPGVDVVFVASTDLSSFSGYKQGDPQYDVACYPLSQCHHEGRPQGRWTSGLEKPRGLHIFQGPGESALIRMGARKAALGAGGAARPPGSASEGVAPTEGSEGK